MPKITLGENAVILPELTFPTMAEGELLEISSTGTLIIAKGTVTPTCILYMVLMN